MNTIENTLRKIVSSLNYEYSELEESCPELLEECKLYLKDFASEILNEAANKAIITELENIPLPPQDRTWKEGTKPPKPKK